MPGCRVFRAERTPAPVANKDFVFPYDRKAADWLSTQGLPHPTVRPGNRLPTEAEAAKAWAVLGLTPDSPLHFEFTDADRRCFTIRGDLVLELRLLRLLCEACGQLWLYPDTGEPPIVVDSTLLPERTDAEYRRALASEDSWTSFHRSVYASAPDSGPTSS